MKFDNRHFQIFHGANNGAPDGIASNHQIEKFFNRIPGEPISKSFNSGWVMSGQTDAITLLHPLGTLRASETAQPPPE